MSFLWDKLLRPAAFRLDAEDAHEMGIKALASGLAKPFYTSDIDPVLECERFGLRFRSPVGVAAGFDKNGVVVDPLAQLGFGFVEVGTVTARPQTGNPRPRLFRIPSHQALINRLGFNNDGAAAVAERLKSVSHRCVVGINIGRNKDVPNSEAIENYVDAFRVLRSVADYIVVNVSSPNTPGLRDLQKSGNLGELLAALQLANNAFADEPAIQSARKPLLVKIAPDLDQEQLESVVEVAVEHELAGIIATNTTISRHGLKMDASRFGDGGLSGRPLRERSTEVIRSIYRLAAGRLDLIGVGGIFTAEDAFEKIAAGARLVQAYTGFVYGGPGFATEINHGLAAILRDRGFGCVDDAVGSSAV